MRNIVHLDLLLVNAPVDVTSPDVDQLPPDPGQHQRGLDNIIMTSSYSVVFPHLEEYCEDGEEEGELVGGGEAADPGQGRPVSHHCVHRGQ